MRYVFVIFGMLCFGVSHTQSAREGSILRDDFVMLDVKWSQRIESNRNGWTVIECPGYVLESDKHEHGQCQREQADQVAQAIDVGGQLDGSIESWARLSYVMASLIIRVVVPVAIQMAVPGGVLCGHGQTEDKSASVRD